MTLQFYIFRYFLIYLDKWARLLFSSHRVTSAANPNLCICGNITYSCVVHINVPPYQPMNCKVMERLVRKLVQVHGTLYSSTEIVHRNKSMSNPEVTIASVSFETQARTWLQNVQWFLHSSPSNPHGLSSVKGVGVLHFLVMRCQASDHTSG